MAEEYCVFIGEEPAIDALENLHQEIKSFQYSAGVKVVSYTSLLHQRLCEEYGENPPGGFLDGSDSLCLIMSNFISKASTKGKIAYILEEHFGGWRDSESILWENGNIIFGPFLEHEDQIKVLEKLPIDKEHLYYFTKHDHPDKWLQESC